MIAPVDLIYQQSSEGPADDEASAVPPIEFLAGVENGLADFLGTKVQLS